jgi:hypothetical protein
MSEPVFAIGRSVFELDFPDQREAWTLQTRVSYLFNDKLKQILEEEMRRADVPGVHCILDSLNIDLGDIAYEEIEKELPERLSKALRNALPEAINDLRTQPGSNGVVVRNAENTLRQFQYFLHHGELTWSTATKQTTPEQWLSELIAGEPEQLVQVLRSSGNSEFISRLIYQFSDAQLAALIEVLEPADARFILRYAAHLTQQHRTKPVVSESDKAFRHTKWHVIFTYLLNSRGSVFNRRMFLKSTLTQLAAHYNMSYAALLAHFSAAARDMRHDGVREFTQLLLQLEMEEEASVLTANTDTDESSSTLYLLRHFLLYGSLPAANKMTRQAFTQAVSQLVFKMPRQLAGVLRQTGIYANTPVRYLALVREPARTQTIHALEPADAPFILGFLRTSTEVQQRERISTLPQSEFMQQQWLLVFRFLLTDRGSAFNTRMFVRSTVAQMAAHYNTGYAQLMQHFGKAAKLLHRQLPASLPLILLDLYSELMAAEKTAGQTLPQASEILSETGQTSSKEEEMLPEAGQTLSQTDETLLQAGQTSSQTEKKLSHAEHVLPSNKQTLPVTDEVADKESAEQLSHHYLAGLLLYILLHGRLPWWAKAEEQHTVSGAGYILEQLLPHPGILRETLATASKSEAAFAKLINIAGDNLPKLLAVFSQPESEALAEWLLQLEKQSAVIIQSQQRRSQLTAIMQVRLLQVVVGGNVNSMSVWVNWLNEVWGELTVRSGNPSSQVFQLLLDAADVLPAAGRLLLSGLLKQVYERAGSSVYADAPQNDLQQAADELWRNVNVEVDVADEDEEEAANRIGEAEIGKGDWENFSDSDLDGDEAKFELMLVHTQALRLRVLKYLLGLLHEVNASETSDVFVLLQKSILQPALYAAFAKIFRQLSPQFIDRIVLHTLGEMPQGKTVSAAVVVDVQLTQLAGLLLGNAVPHAAELENSLHKLMRTQPAGWRQYLLALLQLPQARRRLTQLLHASTFMRVLNAVTQAQPQAQAGVPVTAVLQADLLELVRRIFPKHLSKLREFMLLLAMQQNQKAQQGDVWLFVVLSYLAQKTAISLSSLSQQLAEAAKRNTAEWKSDLPRLLEQHSSSNFLARSSDTSLKRLQQLREKSAAEERKRIAEVKQRKARLTTETDEPLGQFIGNAGLVLLWPFLTRLFTRCGWVKGISFTSDQAAYRAVHLLQYLVNKQEQPPEYLLVLNKLLCGLKKAQPVEKEIQLTDEEKQIGEDLLAAVIKQWTVLGNTSIAGLRETFLERNGQLLFTGQHVVLKAERKAFDKLLGRLPWAINLIRLPWMHQPLYVEWKT